MIMIDENEWKFNLFIDTRTSVGVFLILKRISDLWIYFFILKNTEFWILHDGNFDFWKGIYLVPGSFCWCFFLRVNILEGNFWVTANSTLKSQLVDWRIKWNCFFPWYVTSLFVKLQVFIKAWKWLNPKPPSYVDAAKSPSPFFTSKHDNLFTIQYISNLFIREAMITYYYGSPAFRQKEKKNRREGGEVMRNSAL